MKKLIVACMIVLVPAMTLADTPEEKGLAIAREAARRDSGWSDTVANVLMVLRNRQGDESRRELRLKSLELADDGDKSLVIFDEPVDVKGTALLTFSHKTGDDDQWLYLPVLKRVKRIASDNKSGPFMGSEFAYEDISSQEVEGYTYRWLRDETQDGQDAFVYERYPVTKGSGYTRQVMWMDKSEYRPLKIEYYDRKGTLFKTLTLNGYQKYLDQYWRGHDLFMENHQTGKSTRLTWKNYRFKTGLGARDLDQNALARVK